jgi:hypothetical protein
MADTVSAEVIGKLREAAVSIVKTAIYNEVVEPRDAVLARFQPIFSPEHLSAITEEEFRSFLLFENNRHWTGLHRQGTRMCSDMVKLREALEILLNENEPVFKRLDEAIAMVWGMGKNVASAILMVSQPDRYGVWNNRSEANMKRFGIWPNFNRGESFGNSRAWAFSPPVKHEKYLRSWYPGFANDGLRAFFCDAASSSNSLPWTSPRTLKCCLP